MLKSENFRLLPAAEKACLVKAFGQYLHFRIKGWCKIDLYKVTGPEGIFYAEIWYYYDLKTVGLVRTFDAMPPLEPYLENILLRME